jgi:hypothetical protein
MKFLYAERGLSIYILRFVGLICFLLNGLNSTKLPVSWLLDWLVLPSRYY